MTFDMFDCDSDGQTVENFHVGLRPHIVIRAYARCPFLRSWDHEKDAHEMAKCISDFYTQTDIDILRNIAPDVCKLCKVSVAVDKDRALVKETIRQYLPQSVHGIKGRNPPSRF